MIAIDLDVFTPSDDRAVRLVVGKTADQSTEQGTEKPGPRNGGAAASTIPATAGARDVGAGHLTDLTGIENDEFPRIPHMGTVRA